MLKIIHFLMLTIVLLFGNTHVGMAADYRQLSPSDRVTLPKDLYFKPDFRSQWWYVTGHLKGNNGKRYGFEQTFFVVGVDGAKTASAFQIQNLYVVHSALTQIDDTAFLFQDAISRGEFDSAGAAIDHFNVWLGENRMTGDLSQFSLAAVNADFQLFLDLTAQKSPVKHGTEGYSNKVNGCDTCASLYFSMTDLKVEGRLMIDNETVQVTGKAWFDREVNSESDTQAVKGWDWFSIQLNDGRDIMLYNIRNQNGKIDAASSGTVVSSDGVSRSLKKGEYEIKMRRQYRSKKTGITYPAEWDIIIPSEQISLRITPVIADQEVVATYTTFNTYWEGACRVTGSASGNAYVELSGYE